MRVTKGLVTRGLIVVVVVSAVVVVAPGSEDVAGARSFGVTEYAIGGRPEPARRCEIVAGPDGRIWFNENNPSVGNTDPRLAAMTSSGTLTEYPMPHDLDVLTWVGPRREPLDHGRYATVAVSDRARDGAGDHEGLAVGYRPRRVPPSTRRGHTR